jgi:hypothetical protein
MKVKARDFDKKFDEGVDISKHLDMKKAKRPEQEQKRVNVDFPVWMIQLLDKEAKRLGVPRRRSSKSEWRRDLRRHHKNYIRSFERDAS